MIKSKVKSIIDSTVRKLLARNSELEPSATLNVLPGSSEYKYKPPCNIDELPPVAKGEIDKIIEKTVSIPPRNIFLYKNAFITNEGVLFKNFRIASPTLTFHGRKQEYQDSFLLKQWFGYQILDFSDAVSVVHNSNSTNNYYHWLIEACCKLIALKDLHRDAILMVPAPVPEYIAATTSLLGFNKLLPVGKEQIVKAQNLIVVEQTSEIRDTTFNDYTTHQNPLLLQSLRSGLLSALNISSVKPNRCIYISRSKQKIRRLANEEALIETLSSFGFEIFFFEELSFASQVKIMNESAVVIGVHGANLSNILFMQANQVVIELFAKDSFNSVYYRLASYMQMDYYGVGCERSNKPIALDADDVIVDVHEIERLLKKVCTLPE